MAPDLGCQTQRHWLPRAAEGCPAAGAGSAHVRSYAVQHECCCKAIPGGTNDAQCPQGPAASDVQPSLPAGPVQRLTGMLESARTSAFMMGLASGIRSNCVLLGRWQCNAQGVCRMCVYRGGGVDRYSEVCTTGAEWQHLQQRCWTVVDVQGALHVFFWKIAMAAVAAITTSGTGSPLSSIATMTGASAASPFPKCRRGSARLQDKDAPWPLVYWTIRHNCYPLPLSCTTGADVPVATCQQ